MIYFITARDIGRVKIGHAKDPKRRFINLQIGSPVPLALERVCAGGESEEARLHMRFSEHRHAGEWFALAPEIEAHMETLAAPERPARKRKAVGSCAPITAIRLSLGLSQADMAQLMGVTQSTISRAETGAVPLNKRTLLAAQLLLSQAQEGKAA